MLDACLPARNLIKLIKHGRSSFVRFFFCYSSTLSTQLSLSLSLSFGIYRRQQIFCSSSAKLWWNKDEMKWYINETCFSFFFFLFLSLWLVGAGFWFGVRVCVCLLFESVSDLFAPLAFSLIQQQNRTHGTLLREKIWNFARIISLWASDSHYLFSPFSSFFLSFDSFVATS